MKVNLPLKRIEKEIRVGDIVTIKGTPYFIIRENDNKYVAKAFDGSGGAVGSHDSLQNLIDDIKKFNPIHYSKDEYEIVIVAKEVN